MRFTILSHAGLLVEHRGTRVVCDPWLIGSCYWRSWWNFPEPPEALIRDLRANFVYLTHLHWDHFHGPSLRKLFDPATVMLVPKVPTRRMVEDLRWLGFHNIREISHGTSVQIAEDFSLHSYQFGIGVDSAVVLTGNGITLFNCNDAKLFGLPLRQIMRDHPTIDFIFRSHSSAGPIPYCVADYKRVLPEALARTDSADQFARCALHVGARYAIPFASNHCFLHRETVRFNETATTPDDVRLQYDRLAREAKVNSACVVMPPGSSWDHATGFSIREFDFSARNAYIDTLQVKHDAKLRDRYQREDAVGADFESFEGYFLRLLAALPRFVRRRLPPLMFRTSDATGTHRWLLDTRARQVRVLTHDPGYYAVIEVHPAVLRDCTRNRMFSTWTPSKRLTIHLPNAASLATVSRWFTVLDMFELDMFPLKRNLSPRSLSVRLRRWREPLELARLVLRGALGGRPMSVEHLYPLRAASSGAR
jgi:UDP-MurNAc hydroxylase